MADQSLSSAINQAAEEIAAASTKAAGKPVETPEPVAETEVSEVEEIAESETPAEEEFSEEQLAESKTLYKALKGPQANAIIAALAAQAGLLPKLGEAAPTKTEVAAAKREIKDIVRDALGPEYSFLQDKIGKIFDEVAAQQKAETEAKFAEIQTANVEREVVTAYEKLAVETKGESKKFETRMAQLSEEIPIGDMNVKTYMQRLYAIATSERKASPQKIADQIRRNAGDAPNRLRTSAAPIREGIEIPQGKMSIDKAVEWAVGQLQQGKK